ncbi:MAG TPA: MBOAT family O-acyltransferase [Planctomycetota bacterium]|nr:MBOAT family O-acyltransferase [Planctomycetota bacterium]
MEFHSFQFFGFLLLVLGLHYALPKPARRWLLLAASYWFYGSWDVRFLGLILLSTSLDFWLALRIERETAPAPRRRWIVASMVLNLGILGFFKYTNFFLGNFCVLTGADPAHWLLPIVLPVGVSFFTFQSMSYTIDVYRGHIAARRSFVDFALFVAFFPQLVAGPIIKANEFFPRFDHWRAPADRDLQRAVTLVLVGLLQKAALADNLAPVVDAWFDTHDAKGFLPAATAVLAFGLQIFFDFAGYSNIAIGTALLFGYSFPVNFRQPYLALNVAEFWRRWHISLSSWLRDYLYVPLGGNRGGAWRTQRNLMVTMLLGGLWHGASWNFVIWGGLHGLYLAVHRVWRPFAAARLGERITASVPYRLVAWLLTLAAVGLAWVFFRCRSLDQSLHVVGQLLAPDRLGDSLLPLPWLGVIAGTLVVAWLADRRALFERLDRLHWFWRGVGFAGLLFLLTVFAATEGHVAFLYFQF